MNKKYRIDLDPPSELFKDSLSEGGIGSDRLECGWCNRLHLCLDVYDGGTYYDTDEEYIIELAKHKENCKIMKEENSDGVVLRYNCDSIIGRYLNEILFVIECPCNGLARYEKFIWDNKSTCLKYIQDRMSHEDLVNTLRGDNAGY